MTRVLLVSVFVIATCGLVYEFLAGTIASYLLGDSVTQFSTVIGAYLFSMGIGSWISRFVRRRLVAWFIQVEILVGLAGGVSATLLFLSFTELASFRVVLYSLVAVIGTLVGLEIPLLMRILKEELRFEDLVSKVLALDYLGALAASLLFPLWLVPRVGLVQTAFLFGIANVGVALWACRAFRATLGPARVLTGQAAVVLAVLVAGFAGSDELVSFAEGRLYPDAVVHARSTPYQRIVLTRSQGDVRLYLNGHLQFSSFDEYRYHETLVHPALGATPSPRRALVLGGGDGLAVREILRDPRVEAVTLVDLDPAMTELFRDHDALADLNGRALRDPRVRIENADAYVWLEEGEGEYDFVVVDFPDPSNYSVGKLYTKAFYRSLERRLAPGGAVAIQSTSPLFARRSFWCIVETVRAAGFEATPYHAYVPSFGEWGFVVATREAFRLAPERLPGQLRFLDRPTLEALFRFPADMAPVEVEVNRLDNQILVRYYESEWREIAD